MENLPSLTSIFKLIGVNKHVEHLRFKHCPGHKFKTAFSVHSVFLFVCLFVFFFHKNIDFFRAKLNILIFLPILG